MARRVSHCWDDDCDEEDDGGGGNGNNDDDDDADADNVWQVLVRQELYRKHGYAIQADEEQLRTKLEAIHSELSAPMQFKVSYIRFNIKLFLFNCLL